MPGGGSLPAGTYYYKVVARVRRRARPTRRIPRASAEVSATIAAGATGGGRRSSWTPVAGADELRRLRPHGRRGRTMYWKTTAPYFTDTGAAGTAGTPPANGTQVGGEEHCSS